MSVVSSPFVTSVLIFLLIYYFTPKDLKLIKKGNRGLEKSLKLTSILRAESFAVPAITTFLKLYF